MEAILINNGAGGQKRIKWLDILKGISMFMIILAHSGAPQEYTWFYNPFFLSAFFFVSGYTFRPMQNTKQFVVHKLKGQVYPFVVFGFINAVIAIIIEHDSWIDRLQFLISRNRVWDDMWFIACLVSSEFVFYLLFRITEKCFKEQDAKLIMLLIVSLVISYFGILYIRNVPIKLPWQFEYACSNVIFVAIGYVMKKKEEKFIVYNKIRWWTIISIIYIAVVLVFPNQVAIHSGEYANWVLYLFDATLGIASLVLFSQMIEKYLNSSLISKFIVFVGANTLVYYAFQSKVIKIVKMFLIKINMASMSSYFSSLIVAFITAMILIIPAYIIRKKMPFLLRIKS